MRSQEQSFKIERMPQVHPCVKLHNNLDGKHVNLDNLNGAADLLNHTYLYNSNFKF